LCNYYRLIKAFKNKNNKKRKEKARGEDLFREIVSENLPVLRYFLSGVQGH
jgi:hypothetical protein